MVRKQKNGNRNKKGGFFRNIFKKDDTKVSRKTRYYDPLRGGHSNFPSLVDDFSILATLDEKNEEIRISEDRLGNVNDMSASFSLPFEFYRITVLGRNAKSAPRVFEVVRNLKQAEKVAIAKAKKNLIFDSDSMDFEFPEDEQLFFDENYWSRIKEERENIWEKEWETLTPPQRENFLHDHQIEDSIIMEMSVEDPELKTLVIYEDGKRKKVPAVNFWIEKNLDTYIIEEDDMYDADKQALDLNTSKFVIAEMERRRENPEDYYKSDYVNNIVQSYVNINGLDDSMGSIDNEIQQVDSVRGKELVYWEVKNTRA